MANENVNTTQYYRMKIIYLEGPLLSSPQALHLKIIACSPNPHFSCDWLNYLWTSGQTQLTWPVNSINIKHWVLNLQLYRKETMTVRKWGSQFTLAWTLFFSFQLFSPGPVIQHKLDFFGAYMVLDCWIHLILLSNSYWCSPFGALGSGSMLPSLSGLSTFKVLGSDGINYCPHIESTS